MTKMKLKIAHQVPGRIRLKVPSVKSNPELAEQIRQTFQVIPGIEQVTVNPVTGSVVLQYDTERHDEFHRHLHQHTGSDYKPPLNEVDALADKIEQEAKYLAEHSHTAKVVVDFCKDFDRQIKLATDNSVDLKILLAAGIAGITIFEVGATAATPVWVTLSVFGLNHMIQSNMAGQASETMAGPRGEQEEALATARDGSVDDRHRVAVSSVKKKAGAKGKLR